MPLLVTGSIGIDTVKTPFGLRENCLGGSAIYFSMAASFLHPVRFTGVIGPDCPFDLKQVFAGRDVDLAGLEIRPGSRTFRWKGSYFSTMNDRVTDRLELNVLAEAPPKVPPEYRDSKYVFLANTAPKLQQELLEQIQGPAFVAADTMNCWIHGSRDDLMALLAKIDCLIINEDEARLLTANNNLIAAGQKVLGMGPHIVIIKKGESGSLALNSDGAMFLLPAYPSQKVRDPTGAGDSFAGALMGYLASVGAGKKPDFESLKKGIAYGTVLASFTIEDFSLEGLMAATPEAIEERMNTLRMLTRF